MLRIPSTASRALAAIALSVGALVLSLLCLELAAHWLVPQPSFDRSGPSIAMLRKPNMDASFWGVRFRTNSIGFRGPDYPSRAAPGVRRIAITGDSFVMGWGVSEDDTYVMRLQRLLNEEASTAGTDSHEVINAGLFGINIAQAMRRLATAVDAYSPHLVVYGATLNDIVGPNYKRTYSALRGLALAKRYTQYEDSRSRLLQFLWPRWVALEQRYAPSVDLVHALSHNYFDNQAAWADFTTGLDKFAAIASGRDLCGHVLIHTDLNDLDANHAFLDIYRRIERAALDRGLSVTVSFPYFENRRPLGVKISISDSHPNREGHTLLARALFDGLEALPRRCGLFSARSDLERS